jgi:hypothetical protein
VKAGIEFLIEEQILHSQDLMRYAAKDSQYMKMVRVGMMTIQMMTIFQIEGWMRWTDEYGISR